MYTEDTGNQLAELTGFLLLRFTILYEDTRDIRDSQIRVVIRDTFRTLNLHVACTVLRLPGVPNNCTNLTVSNRPLT